MHVLLLGGHGKVALLLSPLLVARGDEVTAVIRNPGHADAVAATGARPLVLDLERGDDLGDALRTADAVVWAAGAGGGDPERTYAVDRDAAIRSMDAAERAGVRRYVMVSWIGSTPEHGISPDNAFYPYADAKLAADEHLRASSLDWTILGPGSLTLDPPTGRITLDPPGDGRVPRADVAAAIAASLTDDRTIGRFLRFGSGETSIAEALVS